MPTNTRSRELHGEIAGVPRDTRVDDLSALVEAQREAFFRDGPPSAAVRRNRIDRLVAVLTENAEEYVDALSKDFGTRPATASYVSDIAGILPDIATTRRHLGKWMRAERVRGNALLGLPTQVRKQPLGVVGVIGPWNFPLGLVVQPAAAAIAAGNRVMIKFSEVTPATGSVFARHVAENFSPDELVVVTGGLDVAQAFSKLRFDHIFFTGSPSVGAIVAGEAAKNLVPVTLELGGKNPAVVGLDANVVQAAERIAAARLVNGGQLCLCPEEAYVPSGRVHEFVDAVLDEYQRIAPTLVGNPDLVSIVNERNFERVRELIGDAASKGALVLQRVPDGEVVPDPATRRIAPTVLSGVTDAMRVSREEVFGPVLSVFPYAAIDEVIDKLNRRPSPLAAYWFGSTGRDFTAFLRRTTSGGVSVNDFAAHCAVPRVPFGGVGGSGWGAYHGRAGFDTFSHKRTVVRSRLPMSLGRMMTPPYPRLLDRAVRIFVSRSATKARARVDGSGGDLRVGGRPRGIEPHEA